VACISHILDELRTLECETHFGGLAQLDEEKSKHAGLAQEKINCFDSA
jgi:hypothetical protein